MIELTHSELCKIAERWLGKAKKNNINFKTFPIHAKEMICQMVAEVPDAIGWNYCYSCVIEVKVSRSDFLADLKKEFRTNGDGMGNYRFYMCPENLIKECDLPQGWGLIYVDAKGKTKEIKRSEFFELSKNGYQNEKCYLYTISQRLKRQKSYKII